jgi:hypothetical protein
MPSEVELLFAWVAQVLINAVTGQLSGKQDLPGTSRYGSACVMYFFLCTCRLPSGIERHASMNCRADVESGFN